MSKKVTAPRTCRICGRPASLRSAHYPFCSEQCRERDLGNWASGLYRVAAGGDEDSASSRSGPGSSPAHPDDE